ncbi:GntR family transcriptional regulator [Virgibacillus soli]|uniref:GntR family transcriptional regulator n=1 Tax=Paracerasibacillus soli TaxID=480284 RepID=UPI0035E5FCFB
MKMAFDESKPIFLQIKEQLEDSILNDTLKSGERVPSTNEFATFYKINPATAGKGINELVQEDILLKRRGVGMFVTENAKELIMKKRKKAFYDDYLLPLQNEAKKLRISKDELIKLIERGEKDI